ncbi:MAG: P-type conjugative transfer ATPase TrbB, partial [Brevundimonas sp.]
MSAAALSADRRLEALRHALGPEILKALDDPEVVEVLANPDGRLVVDRLREGRRLGGVRLAPEARARGIRLGAAHGGAPVTRADPRLSGVLPGGERV